MSTKKSVSPGKSETKKRKKPRKNNSHKTATKKKAPKKKRKPNPIKNSKPWPPGTSGNLNGRPKKILKHIMDELKLKGCDPVSPANVKEAFEIVMNLDTNEIIAYAGNNDIPILLRIVATSLLDKNKRFDILDKMLNRAHGMPKQSSQVVVEDKKAMDLSDKSFEELYLLKYGKKPE